MEFDIEVEAIPLDDHVYEVLGTVAIKKAEADSEYYKDPQRLQDVAIERAINEAIGSIEFGHESWSFLVKPEVEVEDTDDEYRFEISGGQILVLFQAGGLM